MDKYNGMEKYQTIDMLLDLYGMIRHSRGLVQSIKEFHEYPDAIQSYSNKADNELEDALIKLNTVLQDMMKDRKYQV